MAYIDSAYYEDTYQGKPVSAAAFGRLAERASESVAGMSPHVLHNGTGSLTADELTAVKKATCAMVEFLASADEGAYSSEKIGSYSYTAAQNFKEAETEAIRKSRTFLDAQGLTYCGERPRPT
jgi:hypothetical protein